jgi:hypothetical protein
MPTKAKAVKCVAYTGIGAKPSGLHTPKEFLATTRDERTVMMCNEAKKGRRKMTGKSTIDENIYTFSTPKCPKKNDVKGWMKWTGANACTKAQEKELKKRK